MILDLFDYYFFLKDFHFENFDYIMVAKIVQVLSSLDYTKIYY